MSTESHKYASAHELPTTHFYSIEYPGYVRPESVGKAIHTLGGQSSIDRAFRRSASREDSLLELNLRPDNPFSHPLLGDLVPTNNILLRVVKRKLKHPRPDDDVAQTVGEYTAVAVGVIPKTARFRSEQPLLLYIAFVEPYGAMLYAEMTFFFFIRIRYGRLSVPTRSR